MGKVYVLGSINCDLVIGSSKLPKAGETLSGHDFFMNPGGKGANQAVAAKRCGAEVSMIAKIGKDEIHQKIERIM